MEVFWSSYPLVLYPVSVELFSNIRKRFKSLETIKGLRLWRLTSFQIQRFFQKHFGDVHTYRYYRDTNKWTYWHVTPSPHVLIRLPRLCVPGSTVTMKSWSHSDVRWKTSLPVYPKSIIYLKKRSIMNCDPGDLSTEMGYHQTDSWWWKSY